MSWHCVLVFFPFYLVKCSFFSLFCTNRLVNKVVCETAMLKSTHFCRVMLCISAIYVVVRCPSVCPSRSCILSKRMNIFHNFFSPSGSHKILVFHTKHYGNIPTGPPNWDKNRDFRPISGFGIDHCWTVACRQHFDVHVVRLPPSTNAAAPRISDSWLWQKAWTLLQRQQNRI